MRKQVLLMKKSAILALTLRYGILSKGGVLPPGSIRVWGGKEYVKVAPGDWRPRNMLGNGKLSASLKDNIHTILYGSKAEKEKLAGRYFYIADTPQFMKDKGLKGDYFSIRYGVISRHLGKDNDHALSENNWIDLCNAIIKPFAIAKRGKTFRLFTSVIVNNHYVMVGVDVKKVGKGLEVNSVNTVFGYNHSRKEDIIYKAKKITPEQTALLVAPNATTLPPVQGADRP